MTISLNSDSQKLIEQYLKTGAYRSVDDVVNAALKALDELESRGLDAQTLADIDRAEDQIDRGEVHDWNAVREQVRAGFIGK